MTKKAITNRFLLIIAILLVILCWLIYHKQMVNNLNQTKIKLQEANELYERNIQEFSWLRSNELETEGIVLPNIELIDSNKQVHSLKELVGARALIFRIFENSCTPCLEDNFTSLKKMEKLPIFIIGSFYNTASYKSFIRLHDLKNCYKVKSDSLLYAIPMEKSQLLYYTCLDSQLKANRIVIPIRGYHAHTKLYLEKIKKRLEH